MNKRMITQKGRRTNIFLIIWMRKRGETKKGGNLEQGREIRGKIIKITI